MITRRGGVTDRARRNWPSEFKVHPNLHAAITARAGDREASLRKAIERRRDDEVPRVGTFMGQFLGGLSAALAGLR
jgi:hypothetical protein